MGDQHQLPHPAIPQHLGLWLLWLKHPFLGTVKSATQLWPRTRGCAAQGYSSALVTRVFPAFRKGCGPPHFPSQAKKE